MTAELIAALLCVALSLPLAVSQYRYFTKVGHR